MRFGLWLPVYGGWLRAKGFDTAPSFEESQELAGIAERYGFSTLYASENFLNCVHGPAHDIDDAWALLAALSAITRKVELVGAIKPSFRPPLVAAQQIATVDRISRGRLGINIVCGWWRREFERCHVPWRSHDTKYSDASAYLMALEEIWGGKSSDVVPQRRLYGRDRLPVWIGGHSEAALHLAARQADTLFINGMTPDDVRVLHERVARMAAPRRAPRIALNAFVILEETDHAAEARRQELLSLARPELIAMFREAHREAGTVGWAHLSENELIDPNGGFASALVGSASTIVRRLEELQAAGVDMVVCQFADMRADAKRFGFSVIPAIARPKSRTLSAQGGVRE
jgi:FMNH2-dependent dimethyl sulfone monooxygenase